MHAVLRLFWEICLLRKGPQDIPASNALLVVLLPAALVIDIFNATLSLPEAGLFKDVLIVLAYTASMLILTVLLLRLFGYGSRSLQTLIALIGTGLIISVGALPVLLLLPKGDADLGPLGLILLLLELWSLVITAHILRHALSVSILLGIMLSLGYMFLGFQIVALFLPQGS